MTKILTRRQRKIHTLITEIMKDAAREAKEKANRVFPNNEPYSILYWLELESAVGRRIKSISGELKQD
jgi:hypothetical protein